MTPLAAEDRVIEAPSLPWHERPAIDRIMERLVLDENGCWLVTGSLATTGYGQVRHNGRHTSTHRVSYEYFRGEIPSHLQVDHLCRVRHCANPWHMELVTRAENVLRGEGLSAQNARKTHCKRGHPFDEQNTYHHGGLRHCRACRRERKRG